MYLRHGELDKLEAMLGDSLKDPQASDALSLAGARLRIAQNRIGEAGELIDRVLIHEPGNWEAHLLKGQTLLASGQSAEALAELEQSHPPSPQAELILWTGKALEYNQRSKEAESHYRKAIALDPQLVEAKALYGRLLAYGGAAKKAIAELEPITSSAKQFPYIYIALGRARHDLGKFDAAIADFKRATKLDPQLFEAHYWAGRIQGDHNDHAAAMSSLKRAVGSADAEGHPYLADAYRRLGRAQLEQGQKAKAKTTFQRYLELARPTLPDARPWNANYEASKANRKMREGSRQKAGRQRGAWSYSPFRRRAEWSKAADLKSVVAQVTGGSNPSASASLNIQHGYQSPMPELW